MDEIKRRSGGSIKTNFNQKIVVRLAERYLPFEPPGGLIINNYE